MIKCIIFSFIFLFSCYNENKNSFNSLNVAFISWYKNNYAAKLIQDIYVTRVVFNTSDHKEYIQDLKKFNLELSQIDVTKLSTSDQIKYNSINVIKVHESAKRGGFFGGYPFIINGKNKTEEIKENFKKFKINLVPYPWPLHHKMKIFNISQNDLIVTEELENKLFSIRIPFFLNFNFQNLEKCLSSCKKLDLID